MHTPTRGGPARSRAPPPGVCAPRGGTFATPVGVIALRRAMAVAPRRAIGVVVCGCSISASRSAALHLGAAHVRQTTARQPHTTELWLCDGELADPLRPHDGVSDAPRRAQYNGVCAEPLMLAVGNAHIADG